MLEAPKGLIRRVGRAGTGMTGSGLEVEDLLMSPGQGQVPW